MSSQTKNEEVLSRIPKMRVVDLKEELEKRGLPKSGSKQQLADRLKMNILIENQRESQKNAADDEQLPNISMREQLSDQNPLIRDYFQSQAELFHSQKVVKKLYEDMSHAAEGEAAVQNVEMKENEENTSTSASVSPVKATTRGGVAAAATPPPPPVPVQEELPSVIQELPKADVIQEPLKSPELKRRESPRFEKIQSLISAEKAAASVSPAKELTRGIAPAARAATPPPPEPVKEELPKVEEVIQEPSKPEVTVIQEPLKSPELKKKESEIFERSENVEKAASVSPVKVTSTPPVPVKEDLPKVEVVQEPLKSPELEKKEPPELEKKEPPELEKKEPPELEKKEPPELEKKEPPELEKKESQRTERIHSPPSEDVEKPASVSPVKEATREIAAAATPPPPVPVEEELPNVDKEIQEPLKSPEVKKKELPRRKRIHSLLSDNLEEALDYGGSKLKKGQDKVVQIRETKASSDDAHVSTKPTSSFKASPIRIPTSPSPVPVQEEEDEKVQEPQKSQELKRRESQRSKRIQSLLSEDVEEALDYGDEESRQKKEHDEVSWTRRILRLKNRCAVIEKSDKKWNRIDKKPVVVTSNVLETFFPDVKLLPDSELKLEERAPIEAAEKALEIQEKSQENGSSVEEKVEIKLEEHVLNVKRKISIIPFEESVKELTPPRNPPSNILIITNLVRPFTLLQLREMLQRTGTIEDIWVDKIKSKCIAKFEKQEEAEETRAALHGIKWPLSNPKSLIVDYTNEDDFDDHRTKETGEKKIKIEKPSEAKGIPVREWDLGKRERSRSRSVPGRRRRSGSERKRSRKSPSPHLRRHSRSPHHDKKSLRDLESKEEAREGKALDELFRKTTTTPCIYWLPLTPEQISEKEEMRRKRMIERERRIAQIEMAKERQHIRPR